MSACVVCVLSPSGHALLQTEREERERERQADGRGWNPGRKEVKNHST